MRKNLFWLSDEQWGRIEPYLPMDERGVDHLHVRWPPLPGERKEQIFPHPTLQAA